MLRRRALLCIALLLLPALGGCMALPGRGPSRIDIALQKADTEAAPDSYVLVGLDPAALDKVNHFQPLSFPGEFKKTLGGTRSQTIGVGDRLAVNIWEPSQDGVFATTEQKQASLEVVVDEDGKVYIPYAGRITAAGRRVEQLRWAIQAALKGKAVDPQVQVLLSENAANAVVVVGDVAKPGQFPVPVRGLRLMEALAQAGGAREATYETVATVTRGDRSGTVRLDEVVSDPANNIWLAPGDNVLVLHRPRTFSALGAVLKSGLIPFKNETVSLIEGLAQVGGLRDRTADTGGIFLFRFESRRLARWLVETGKGSGAVNGYADDALTPVVYQLDFKDPQALFIAQSFHIRDKDIIYVANHPTAELGKFLSTIVSPLIGVARTSQGFAD